MDTTANTFSQQDKLELLNPKQTQPYINNPCNQLTFLIFNALLSFGAMYNGSFQTYIKEQITKEMSISSQQYSQFVFVPTLPVIILPLLVSPALNYFGNRKGIFFFTLLMIIGMFLCVISVGQKSFYLLLVGKVVHNIGSELIGISQAFYYGKWFNSQDVAKAYTFGVLCNKIASSTSGILYPQFYKDTGNLYFPLIVGLGTCFVSFASAIFAIVIDLKADKDLKARNEQSNSQFTINSAQEQKKIFKIADLKHFQPIFWIFVLQNLLLWSSFYGFLNYLQSVITTKFELDQTLAGQFVSIPYWMAFSSPIFGFITDKFGKRCIGLFISSFLAFVSTLFLYIIPQEKSIFLLVIGLVGFGIYVSLMTVFVYPNLPFICTGEQINIGFGIMLCVRNSGVCVLSYVGNILMGDDNLGYQRYLLTYTCMFFLSVFVSIWIYFYDKNNGGTLNSQKPQKIFYNQVAQNEIE